MGDWTFTKPIVDSIKKGHTLAYAPPQLLIEFYHVVQKGMGMVPHRTRTIKRHDDWLGSLKINFMPVDYVTAQRDLRLLVSRGADSYDAIYIYLARRLGLELWTCDNGILALARGRLGFKVVDLNTRAVSP